MKDRARGLFTRILVPLDGSTIAEQVLPVAQQLAQVAQGTIFLVHIHDVTEYALAPSIPLYSMLEQQRQQAAHYLSSLAQNDILSTLPVQATVVTGETATEIVKYARKHDCDLIVMSSHGKTGSKHWFMGSVAQQVIRQSPVPVLVMNERAIQTLAQLQDTTCPVRIWLPLDGSLEAEAILQPALRLSVGLNSRHESFLHFVRIISPLSYTREEGEGIAEEMMEQERYSAECYLHQMEQQLLDGDFRSYDFTVSSSIHIADDVASGILSVIRQQATFDEEAGCQGLNIIALATHGRKGIARWFMGSVTEHLLGSTGFPILTVHGAKTR